MSITDFPSGRPLVAHPLQTPQFRLGDRVHIVPLEDAPARIISLILAEDGWTIEVRYFHNGEPKTIKCFPDEVRPA